RFDRCMCGFCNGRNFFQAGHSAGRMFCSDVANQQQEARALWRRNSMRSDVASADTGAPGQQTAREPSAARTGLVSAFLTNPFGNEEPARGLLSEIEGRSIRDAELERGVFCFQIAFYYVASLAIADHVGDLLLRKSCINRLYDRVRGFYARMSSTVRFTDFIVAPAERDQFAGGLRETLEDAGEKDG